MSNFLIFLGIFKKCEKLIKFWSRIQIPFILLFWISLPALFVNKTIIHGVLIACGVHIFLVFVLAFVGISKASALRRLFLKAFKIIKKHKNQELVERFGRVPSNLLTIIILDLGLPCTWPFSFLMKLFFQKNLNRIEFLMDASKGLELD